MTSGQSCATAVSSCAAVHAVWPVAGVVLDDVERSLIVQALARSDGNKTEAARLLGVSRDTLRYRLEKYAIT